MKFILTIVAVIACLIAIVCGSDQAAESICSQPKEVGPCRKAAQVFFYNKDTKQCEEFIYGGCHGNENRFETKDECEKACVEVKKE